VAKWPRFQTFAILLPNGKASPTMSAPHKNKTLTTLLASLLGAAGVHRFYLRGVRDTWGWLHLATLPLTALLLAPNTASPYKLFLAAPLIVSMLAGWIEALVLGLTPDAKWDATYNIDSGSQTASTWPLALILALTLAVGMSAVIFLLSRSFDLFFTGGAYG